MIELFLYVTGVSVLIGINCALENLRPPFPILHERRRPHPNPFK